MNLFKELKIILYWTLIGIAGKNQMCDMNLERKLKKLVDLMMLY
jgi:hypothetical protein